MYRERVRKEDFGAIKVSANGEFIVNDNNGQEIALNLFPDSTVIPLTAPITVAVEITRKCNLSCGHCYLNAGTKRSHELATKEIKTLLKKLKDWGVLFVFITGGEATLRPDFKEIVNYLFEIDLDFNVLTNGTILTPQYLSDLNKDTPFVVSFDYISENKYREGQNKLLKPKQSIMNLFKLGFPVIGQATLRSDNIEEIAPIYKWCAEQGVQFELMHVVPEGRADGKQMIQANTKNLGKYEVILEARKEYLKAMQTKKGSYNLRSNLSNPNYYYLIRGLINATNLNSPGLFELYVASNGDVYPSTYYSADNEFVLGNISRNNLPEIWQSSFKLFSMSYFDNLECKDCEIYKQKIFCDFQYFNLDKKKDKKIICAANNFVKQALTLDTKEDSL